MSKSLLAERILKCAARGERDRERLLDAALVDLAARGTESAKGAMSRGKANV